MYLIAQDHNLFISLIGPELPPPQQRLSFSAFVRFSTHFHITLNSFFVRKKKDTNEEK